MAVRPDLIYAESASLCAGVAAVTDLRTKRIPNWLTGLGVLAGLVLHLFCGGMGECGYALLAGLVAGGIFFPLFLAGGMGAGDVKLMAAVGCLGGIHGLRSTLIATVIVGALAAVITTAAKGRLGETYVNVCELFAHHQKNGLAAHPNFHVRNHSMLRLPYALPIAGGCVFTMLLIFCGDLSL